MVIKNFDHLIELVKDIDGVKRVAVVCAHDEHTLEAVQKAENEGLVKSVLIGKGAEIKEILKKLNFAKEDSEIIDIEGDQESSYKAVEIIREGGADFIMKGKIQTGDLLKAVVDKEKGLRTGRVMSHIVFNEVPNYHKLIAITDGGMMMYPDLDKKKQILENAVDALISLGYDKPKVAALAAVEKVNPKMPETVDAGALKDMYINGQIENCIVEGPISYDLTMSRESAEIKGFDSPVTGDADIMLVPNITVGNILGKSLIYSAGARMAGFIVGAKVPIVLTSRGSTSEEKYLSLVLSAAAV
ncbi:phosphate butyryltransferase [Dethiosulfatibacter aminovorans DSM 17477]|uniref:Phosphate butyryltransferase n=1 Tax=Dethiosulfatibacter aminovorans DSM 17477 TaxID=1121476 RepID=A0A1M6KN03_9FIRM|nr:bifunctional enoyl-CoA hydratase/phosphate acetyltransferase [Dethiosulfatibacter aminovorans]SHJ60290.1 phosphate butyryltransferase [Dethiosulfatibacter aminovorans DSM 17477]